MSLERIQTHGNCFAIKHSETTRHIKDGTLVIPTAIAVIAVTGGILGILAINGVNLGGLNSIVSMIGEKYIYIGLAAGTGLLLIDTVLIVVLTRTYYDKQYTQKQIDAFGIGDWLRDEDIATKLEPGQYWSFPHEFESSQAETDNSLEHPAVWGFVVKHEDHRLGVFAFKKEKTALTRISKLKYQDGQRVFTNASEYTRRYVDTKIQQAQIDPNEKQEKLDWINEPLKRGEGVYITINPMMGEKIYGLKSNRNGETQTLFYKSEEIRNREAIGLFDPKIAKETLEEIAETEINSLYRNSYWVLNNPVDIDSLGSNVSGTIQRYAVLSKKEGSDEFIFDLFNTPQEAAGFATSLQGYQDAQDSWNDETIFPQAWMKDKINLEELRVPFEEGAIVLRDLNETIDGVALSFYALFFLSNQKEDSLFFRTHDLREQYIQEHFHSHDDVEGLHKLVHDRNSGPIVVNALDPMLVKETKVCFTTPLDLHGKTYYVLIARNQDGNLDYHKFDSQEELESYKTEGEWNTIDERFSCPGQFTEEWVRSRISANRLEEADSIRDKLKADQFDSGLFERDRGEIIYWIASKEKEEPAQIHYFTTMCTFDQYKKELTGSKFRNMMQHRLFNEALTIKAREIMNIQELSTQLKENNDCYTETITVNKKTVEISFKRVNCGSGGIQISFQEIK